MFKFCQLLCIDVFLSNANFLYYLKYHKDKHAKTSFGLQPSFQNMRQREPDERYNMPVSIMMRRSIP